MARQARIEFPGAYYHVMARGDRREPIVLDNSDRELFLRTLGEACGRTGWKILSWVLMDNHYHLLLQTPEANLVAGMKWFQNTYTRRFNVRHKLWGHVFGGRYKAVLVDSGTNEAYLGILLDYLHLNPVRAGLIKPLTVQGLLSFPWSSLASSYNVHPGKRELWMDVKAGLAFRHLADDAKGRRNYARSLVGLAQGETKRKAGYDLPEGQTLHSTLERGWYWGGETFRKRLLSMVGAKRVKPSRHYRLSPDKKAHDREEASQWIIRGMSAMNKTKDALKKESGSAGWKVVLAWALARRTTQSQGWIAGQLHMKSPGNVSQQLGRLHKGQIKLQPEEKEWWESVKND